MTTTILANGCQWCEVCLYGNWGDCGENADADKTAKMLGNMVVARFDELCQENNIHSYWTPYTSEVIGNIDQDYEIDLDDLRQQAVEEIWERWTDGDIEPILGKKI